MFGLARELRLRYRDQVSDVFKLFIAVKLGCECLVREIGYRYFLNVNLILFSGVSNAHFLIISFLCVVVNGATSFLSKLLQRLNLPEIIDCFSVMWYNIGTDKIL